MIVRVLSRTSMWTAASTGPGGQTSVHVSDCMTLNVMFSDVGSGRCPGTRTAPPERNSGRGCNTTDWTGPNDG